METRNTASASLFRVAGLSALGLIAVLAFLGWNRFGVDILLNAAEAGLSWCL
jgi:hypothetical protein